MNTAFPATHISRHLRIPTAALLCVTMLFSDLPAQAQSSSLSILPRQVTIPAEYGRVEESRQAGPKTIFFLQDAHDSLEAQENIAALIHHLVETSGVKTVFEEGYEGPVPADDYFGTLKDSEVREKVSYYLLDQLRIGGAEYAHINRRRPFKLVGGDDAKLHRENIAWYRKAAEHQEEAAQGLKVLQQEIARLAGRNFPAELKEWMKLKARFDQGKISFWDYLQRLREPGAAFFHEGLPSEAMASRYPVLSRLYRAAMKDLSQELKDGDVNAEVLFRETSDFENDIADTLITLERDRQTFAFYKTLELLLRLNSLEVSYDEYRALRETLPAAKTEDFARFISLHTNRSVSLSKRWEENIQSAMQFYETAGERDRAVEKKLKEFKADSKELSAVLVFGGFHRSAIREMLKRQGFSYQIISPAIAEPQAKHRERYRNLMAADFETRFVPASVSAAARALSDIAVAELSPDYKRRFAEELNVLSRAAVNVRGSLGGDVILGMQQELKKQPELQRSELRAEGSFQRGERLTQEKLEEEVRKLGETSLEVGGNDRTGWAVSTEKRHEHDRLHALERTLSERFKGYRFSYYYDVRSDQNFKRLDILPPLGKRSELRQGLKSAGPEALPGESKDAQGAASSLSGRSELRDLSGPLLGAAVFENPLWLLAVPPVLAAAVYILYKAYQFWITKRVASALARGARYIARGSYTHVLKHAGLSGYVILVKRHPFVMKMKQWESIRSPQVTEQEEWEAYKALKKLGLAPFTRYAGKIPMKNMHPDWTGAEGEDVFRADQKKLAEMYGKVSSSMTGASVYIQEEGVPLNQFVRENPDQKSLADKSLASFTLKLWKAGWIDLDIGRRNYLLVTDREGRPLKHPDGLFRLKAHDFGAIMPIPDDLERFMLSKHADSDVTRGFFLLRNLTATVRAAGVLFPRLDLKRFHEISKAADEAAEKMKGRADKAAFRSAYLGVIESPENKKVITGLSIEAARMIRKALDEGTARSELRAEESGDGRERRRLERRVRAEAEKRIRAAKEVFRKRVIFISLVAAALAVGGGVYWMLPRVPAQPTARVPSEAVIERQRFATIRNVPVNDMTKAGTSQDPEIIDAIAAGYDAADPVRKSQIAGYEILSRQDNAGEPVQEVFHIKAHFEPDVVPPFQDVTLRRGADARINPVDLHAVSHSISGGRVVVVEQVREWMAWAPLALVGIIAVLAYAFYRGARRVDTGSIMDSGKASERSARDISKIRAGAEKKRENDPDAGRSELRALPEEETVNAAAEVLLKFIGQQSGEKLSKMGYRFTIVPDVEKVTMRNLLLNFWPEVTSIIGSDDPSAWTQKLMGIEEGMPGRVLLERIRPLFLAMSRFGRHETEGNEDFRFELKSLMEQRAREADPEPVRVLITGPGYLQEAVEVLAAADAAIEALQEAERPKIRVELVIADLPGELAARYQANQLLYHPFDAAFLPEEVRDRYLEPVQSGYRIRPEVHSRMTFRAVDLNLHRDYGVLGLRRGSLDFVFNHNLSTYLKPRAVRRLSEYLHAALRDSGIMYGRFSGAHFDRSMLSLNGNAYWLGDLFEFGVDRNDKSGYPRQLLYKFYKKGHSPRPDPFSRSVWGAEFFKDETDRENRLDPEDEGWLDRVLGPARSELRTAGQEDALQNLKADLLGLMTAEGSADRNVLFNTAAGRLKAANPSVKGRFKKLLLELLDNRLEGRALREIGSRERETSAWQRAVYRRLYEHLYDERGRLRKDITKLEAAPSAAATLKYEDTFTVGAGRRKETLRVERLTSLSHSDWSQIFEIYGPHNLREFYRDLMAGRRNLSGNQNAVFVVRTSENKIAGFSWAFADPGKKMLGLAVSGVAKPYRGKGLAARLLISRLEWGLSNGLTYARTHVGGSGRINGWHWRLLSLGGRIDSLSLQSPLPEIGIRPEDQAAADQAIRAAQSKPYPQSRKPVESVLKKHPDADVVVTFNLSYRLLGSMKGKVLAENVRSELRASEPGTWKTLKEQMDHLLKLYPTENSRFYELAAEEGFLRKFRELLLQYREAEDSFNANLPEAKNQFEGFQRNLTALLTRLELLLEEDHSAFTEFHPGAANATFGVMAVQLKPEVLQDETPRQFFFGPFSIKQLVDGGLLKVDLKDGAVVSALPEVKGVLSDRYPEVMREKLEKIQKLTASFWEDFPSSRSELRAETVNLQDFVNLIISGHGWPDIIEVDIDSSFQIKETSASLGLAIFELLKNAIDGNRVYEKKSGTDSRPDVRLSAVKKDGWVELRIENRGVLALDKLRSQARDSGVWKLRSWAPDKHLWPYPYIMESSMPDEPMPYQRMRPEEIDAMADEDLLFHVKGLTLRSDENLRRIGLLRADLTGGMGIGLKQVWRVMEMVDPERPVHYEIGEIDGAPSVIFSVRLPEALPRSELRVPSDGEYERIAAEAERLRELVELHSLLQNKPDGTGKSDIVKALAEVRDLSRDRGDIELIAEIVKRANGWYPGRVNRNYFQFDDRDIKKQLAAFSRAVQKTLRDANDAAPRSELRMFINDLVRQQFAIAGVPFLDEHISTDKGVFRPTLSGLVDPLAEYAGNYEPVRIIDLGSGQGAMVFAFARANDRAEVLGIEYDERLFNDSVKVRDSFFEDTRKRIRLERGDFNDPRFAEEIQKADLVNYWETGSGAEGKLIETAAKNLRPGARFLVTKNSGRFIKAVLAAGYFEQVEHDEDNGIFLFKRNEKSFAKEGDSSAPLAGLLPEAGDSTRSELRTSEKAQGLERLDPERIYLQQPDFLKAVDYFNEKLASAALRKDLPPLVWGDLIALYEIIRGDNANPAYGEEERLARFSHEDAPWVLEWLQLINQHARGPEEALDLALRVYRHSSEGEGSQQMFVNKAGFARVRPVKPEKSMFEYHPADGHHRLAWFLMNFFLIRNGYEPFYFKNENEYLKIPISYYNRDEGIDRLRKLLAERVFYARSELRNSADSGEFRQAPVEKMTVPAAVFLDARELLNLKEGQADERFDELLTFLERHPAFDLYIDHGDDYPLHNLELPKLRQILNEFPGRVHFGEHSRANLAKKKILLQVSLFEDAGSSAETRKLIQDIQRRYRIQSDLLPVEYLRPGSLKGFLGLAESFTQAEMIREIGEAYATRGASGRWRLAADFAASLWARIQNDYAIQWSA